MNEFLITTEGVVLTLVPQAACTGCYFLVRASGAVGCCMVDGSYKDDDVEKCAVGRGSIWVKVKYKP